MSITTINNIWFTIDLNLENKKNTALDESEIESLSILILSTNYELDAVLRRIDGHIRENVIKIMKELVVSLLRSQNLNLIFISAEIDDKLEKLHQLQRSHSKYKHNLVKYFENIRKTSYVFVCVGKYPKNKSGI